MLQLSQIKVPVSHTDDDLKEAAALVLGLKRGGIRTLKIKQRAIDARRGQVMFSYTLLIEVADEVALLRDRGKPGRVEPAPDETYREFVADKERGQLGPETGGRLPPLLDHERERRPAEQRG